MPGPIQIRCLQAIDDRQIQELSDLLVDCVEGGASVSFSRWPCYIGWTRPRCLTGCHALL